MPDAQILAALVDLRFKRLQQTPLYQGGLQARRVLRSSLRAPLASALGAYDFEAWWDGDRIRAALFHHFKAEGWHGGPVQSVFAETAIGDAQATDWLLSRFLRRKDAFGRHVELDVYGWQPALRAGLVDQGFGVEALTLIGSPRRALDGLIARCDPPVSPSGELQIEPLRTRAQADAVVQLRAELFGAAPQYCWFGAQPAFLEMERSKLHEKIRLGDSLSRVLVNPEGTVVGYFGADIETCPHWGRSSGLDLLIAPAYQGRGLVKIAYRVLLEALVAAGCTIFRGGTSQPAVMALGQIMGRQLHGVTLRKGAHFSPAHFASWLDPAPHG